jgi:hemolysin III
MKKLDEYTFGEEVANAITHGIPALLVLFSIPVVSIIAYTKGTVLDVVGVNIFCFSIFIMFLMSTIYHSMENKTNHKNVFQILDHVFIYVAIAGSYTPIALSILEGWRGIVILTIQWIMVILGVLYKSIALSKMPRASLIIYLVMGWSIIMFLPTLINKADPHLLWLLILGGILYSLGAIFYAKPWFAYHHAIWHLFVFLGALTHYIGICFFLY